MVAQVYINTGSAALDKPFDYIVPPKLEKSVVRGVRVKVPFGGGQCAQGGICFGGAR